MNPLGPGAAMALPETIAILSAGGFFLTALLTGIWKFRQIMQSESGEAHPYVDICHRASLMYSFAAMLVVVFARISQLPTIAEVIAVSAMMIYFGSAILTYMIHGLLRDTDNQLRRPFRMGHREVSGASISFYMWTLIAAEVGGFVVLFYGVIVALLGS